MSFGHLKIACLGRERRNPLPSPSDRNHPMVRKCTYCTTQYLIHLQERAGVNVLFFRQHHYQPQHRPQIWRFNLAREREEKRRLQMLRRSVLSFTRRPLSTMASQTPMEDAMRTKVVRSRCPRSITNSRLIVILIDH